jgi:hypothetical protein
MAHRIRTAPLVLGAGLLVSACSDGALVLPEASGGQADVGTASGVDLPPAVVLDVPDPDSVYDPVRGGEPLPDGFRQLLVRDAIAPVYDPTFTVPSGVDWPEESLVIGVDFEGEARAYPVGFLNRREIVNDDHRGIPTLVTW